MPRLAVAALVVSAAGCIPGRDNPNDPVNRPIAIASIERAGLPIEFANRSDTGITLRASASEPLGAELQVRWFERLAPITAGEERGWDPVVAPLDARVPAEYDFARVDRFLPTSGTSSAVWQLRAEVTDPERGGTDTAEFDVVVFNAAPSFVVRRLWDYPAGGRWWSGEPFIVDLPYSISDDAAGEAVEVVWTQTSGPAVSFSAQAVSLRVTVPLEPATLTFQGEALDTHQASGRAEVTVQVGPALWLGRSAAGVERIEDVPLSFPQGNTILDAFTGSDLASGEVWTVESSSGVLQFVLRDSEMTRVASVDATSVGADPNYFEFRGGFAVDGESWVAFNGGYDTCLGTLLHVQVNAQILEAESFPWRCVMSVAPRPDGSFWVASSTTSMNIGGDLTLVASDGDVLASVTVPLTPGDVFPDPHGGVWLTSTPDPPTYVLLSHYDDSANLISEPVVLADYYLIAVDPLSGRFAATVYAEDGVVALTDSNFEPVFVSDFSYAGVADFEANGEFWAWLPQVQGIVRFAADGTVVHAQSVAYFTEANLSPDPDGRLWAHLFHNGSGESLGDSSLLLYALDQPAPERLIPEFGVRTVLLDPERSRLLLKSNYGLALFDTEGQELKSWTLESLGALNLRDAVLDPGTGRMWVTTRLTGPSPIIMIQRLGTPDDPCPGDAPSCGATPAGLGLALDPLTGEICHGHNVFSPNVGRLSANGVSLWTSPGIAYAQVLVAPDDGACVFFLNGEGIVRFSPDGTPGAPIEIPFMTQGPLGEPIQEGLVALAAGHQNRYFAIIFRQDATTGEDLALTLEEIRADPVECPTGCRVALVDFLPLGFSFTDEFQQLQVDPRTGAIHALIGGDSGPSLFRLNADGQITGVTEVPIDTRTFASWR